MDEMATEQDVLNKWHSAGGTDGSAPDAKQCVAKYQIPAIVYDPTVNTSFNFEIPDSYRSDELIPVNDITISGHKQTKRFTIVFTDGTYECGVSSGYIKYHIDYGSDVILNFTTSERHWSIDAESTDTHITFTNILINIDNSSESTQQPQLEIMSSDGLRKQIGSVTLQPNKSGVLSCQPNESVYITSDLTITFQLNGA